MWSPRRPWAWGLVTHKIYKYSSGQYLVCPRSHSDDLMASIQDLPEDLLFVIFQMIQRQELGPRSVQSPVRCRSLLRCLTRLSLVRRGWRETMLRHGTFWAYIPVDSTRDDALECATTMLQRSKGTELGLSVYLGTNSTTVGQTNDLMKVVLDQGSRVRSLHLIADPRSAFGSNVPSSGSKINNFITPDNPIAPAPSQHLWSLLGGLSMLSLSLPSPTIVVEISSLLQIIKTSPRLESLHLTSIIPIKEDCPLTCVVHAPSLQRLCLKDCSSATILSHIVVSKQAAISITLSNRRIRKQRRASFLDAHILQALPYSLSNIHALEDAKQLILEEDEGKGMFSLGLSCFRSRGSSVVVRNLPSYPNAFIYRSLSAISNHPFFGAVESFTFSYYSHVPACLSTVLSRFNLLLELNTSSHHGAGVVCALMHKTPDGSPPCPSLRRIRFFHRRPDTLYFPLDPHLLTMFRQFRTETCCSSVRITVHYNGRKDEL